jgi:hypothetical protein
MGTIPLTSAHWALVFLVLVLILIFIFFLDHA